jgi:hypothetical protein
MKTSLLGILLTFYTLQALSQTTEEIGNDFQAKAAKACERIHTTLQTEGTAIAARLLSDGDSKGAATVSAQVKTKANGGQVAAPHAALVTLFSQYDAARLSIVKPFQDASLERLNTLLKSSAGKDLQNVTKAAKVREEILAGPRLRSQFGNENQVNPMLLETLFVDKSWYSTAGTEYHFEKGNTGYRKLGGTQTPFTWRVASDNIVEVKGQMAPSAPPVMFYFRFTNDKEATFGRGNISSIGDPLTSKKPR